MIYYSGKLSERIMRYMTVKNFIKNLLTRSCVYFSAIMLIYIIIAAIVNVDGSQLLLDASRVVLFFAFACLLSGARAVYAIETLSGGVRLLCHFIITLFAFYTCLIMPLSLRPASSFVGIVLFAILYFAIFGIYAAISSKYRKNKESHQSYTRQFKGK